MTLLKIRHLTGQLVDEITSRLMFLRKAKVFFGSFDEIYFPIVVKISNDWKVYFVKCLTFPVALIILTLKLFTPINS